MPEEALELKLIYVNNNKSINFHIYMADDIAEGVIKPGEGEKIALLDNGYYLVDSKDSRKLIKVLMFNSSEEGLNGDLKKTYIIYSISSSSLEGATIEELMLIGKCIK